MTDYLPVEYRPVLDRVEEAFIAGRKVALLVDSSGLYLVPLFGPYYDPTSRSLGEILAAFRNLYDLPEWGSHFAWSLIPSGVTSVVVAFGEGFYFRKTVHSTTPPSARSLKGGRRK